MFQQPEERELAIEDLNDFVALAASFAEDLPGRDWAELDLGSETAITRSWQALSEIGFDRCFASAAAAGAELPADALIAIVEELATGDGGIALLMLLSNIAVGAMPAELVDGLDGAARLAYVPAVGSRRRDQRLPELAGGRIRGSAPFVLGGFAAEGFVVACEAEGSTALAWVAADAPTVQTRQLTDQLALGAARATEIELNEAEAVQIGDAGDVDRADALLNLGIAAIARGTARRARALALDYAENRYQGGGQIIIHGAVRDMLARMSERELGMPQPKFARDGDELAIGMAAKIALSDAAVLSTIDAIQVFGGMGYMRETGVEKLMRDAKYCQLYPRPNWITRDDLLETQRRAA